ncbi:hypothetical protein CIB48_g3135 [Xylaria polymorpha]|nr:hypothetical protein CIB48_g3135 [Xylaria polymorpha]
MQTSIIIATLFAAIALAAPAQENGNQQTSNGNQQTSNGNQQTSDGNQQTSDGNQQTSYVPCSGQYATSQCCATDAQAAGGLDCATPPSVPNSAANFSSVCAAIGQQARCCVTSSLGQDVQCQTPSGI